VIQTFTANKIPLFYWNSGNRAEVDFVANLAEGIIPIEVKSGRNVGSKSLNVYVEKYKPPYAIRISVKNYGFENGIKSVPLYAAFCVYHRQKSNRHDSLCLFLFIIFKKFR
jgi:predicted AAA+ superfamily ATPase